MTYLFHLKNFLYCLLKLIDRWLDEYAVTLHVVGEERKALKARKILADRQFFMR